MYKLKLIKGRSYTGYGISATLDCPFIETDKKEISDSLVSSGYFSFVGEDNSGEDRAQKTDDKPLEKMTEKELDVYAAENGIDISGISKKADKLAAVQKALAESDDGLFNDEN